MYIETKELRKAFKILKKEKFEYVRLENKVGAIGKCENCKNKIKNKKIKGS